MDELISLSSCAEKLGTSTRRLRYFLAKEQVVPYRGVQAGKFRIRVFLPEDYAIVEQWWQTKAEVIPDAK